MNRESAGSDILASRLPPHSLEAERGVLGSMLLDNQVIDEVIPILRPGEFYRDSHEIMCRWIFALRDKGNPVDSIMLENELRRHGAFDRIGGLDAIDEIMRAVPHAIDGAFYAHIVHEKAVARELIDAGHRIINDGYSNTYTADELLGSAESTIFAIGDRGQTSTAVIASERTTAVRERAQARREGRFSGVLTGFVALDETAGGFDPGAMVVLGARPSQGKTALALNIAVNAAASPGRIASLFISLEMREAELMDRLMSAEADIDAFRLKRGRLTDGEHQRFQDAERSLAEWAPILIDDSPGMNVTKIAAAARRAKARHGIGLLVVDYLQLIDPYDTRAGRQEQVARISSGLKRIGRELSIPTLILAQLNRMSEQREDRRPRLAELRESGQIEADADLVLLLHRPEFYDPNDKPGVAELNVAKNRNGRTGQIDLTFLRHCTRFESIDERAEEQL